MNTNSSESHSRGALDIVHFVIGVAGMITGAAALVLGSVLLFLLAGFFVVWCLAYFHANHSVRE